MVFLLAFGLYTKVMANYAVGDLQGCYDSLQRLLEELQFDASSDTLWLAGDLVNRGSKSLETLRFLKSLGSSARCVLGNHDISMIAAHYGVVRSHPSTDTLMKAPDRFELIDWLRTLPLIQVAKDKKICMVHAGIPPFWSVKKAKKLSKSIQEKLQDDDVGPWLRQVYGNKPNKWSKELIGNDRDRYILNAFTRMRFLRKNGALNLVDKASPISHKRSIPWFEFKKRKNKDYTIFFGHWASLGYYHGHNVVGLDSGCVWGNTLTAVNIDVPYEAYQPISVKCP
ncbi:MAG: Bis(5'-nucleosyl)-tetraphosphatase, symmetrical (EC [uncultured Thiotrichaceae bacterium]|uniref:bis(5'-nucleosyl)-tetraphosphatase (symmetrical) n=1 Tax=uncultured Thiotrichaceae bacterium TaxID=298394 RepID=A0A6S6TW24_9GAMM|nr:MAG: Bis(5'-nucleosyl)-tetraphosphatase, symmetrical (EC [uncultured Thiotrichaceae bacterium]